VRQTQESVHWKGAPQKVCACTQTTFLSSETSSFYKVSFVCMCECIYIYKLHLFIVIVHTDTSYLQKDLVLQTLKASLM